MRSESDFAARELPENEDFSDNPGVAGTELRKFTV
jgi:hypothetical protein